MNQFEKKTWKSDPQEPKEEQNPDADTDVDSSSDEEEKNVKHDPDKVIKTEDGDIKQDPDQPAKLETGQRENETLAEFKLRWINSLDVRFLDSTKNSSLLKSEYFNQDYFIFFTI